MKNFIKSSMFWLITGILFFAVSLISYASRAADSVTISSNPAEKSDIWPYVLENWQTLLAILGVLLLEIFVRLKPTDKDWSILNFIIRMINFIVPNKAKKAAEGYNYFFKITKKQEPIK